MHPILRAKQVSPLKRIHLFLFCIQTLLQVHSLRRTIKERPGTIPFGSSSSNAAATPGENSSRNNILSDFFRITQVQREIILVLPPRNRISLASPLWNCNAIEKVGHKWKLSDLSHHPIHEAQGIPCSWHQRPPLPSSPVSNPSGILFFQPWIVWFKMLSLPRDIHVRTFSLCDFQMRMKTIGEDVRSVIGLLISTLADVSSKTSKSEFHLLPPCFRTPKMLKTDGRVSFASMPNHISRFATHVAASVFRLSKRIRPFSLVFLVLRKHHDVQRNISQRQLNQYQRREPRYTDL